ncbi:hypothetical protein ABPG75_002723 [Micractinium tetrahymenae]
MLEGTLLPKRKRGPPADSETACLEDQAVDKLEGPEMTVSRSCIRRAACRRSLEERRQRLEEKLASAEANRQRRLQAVVARAADRHSAVQARAAALKARQSQLAAQLEAHLQQAQAARSARLAETAARAGQQFARVREAAAEQKLRAAVEVARRKQAALARLERAERHRQEALQAMLAAVQAKRGGEDFLPREAARREQLRRKSSSRKLQAAWRAFRETRKTTCALAQAFVDTGVPFTVPLTEPELGPPAEPAPAAASLVAPVPAMSADPTPAGTPEPCSSPTSTVRRQDGRLASAPMSIPQTPQTTPNRTPATSVPSSPTGSLARRLGAEPAGTPPAIPPLRSIAAPATPPGLAERELAAGPFERLAAALSAPATLAAAQALLVRLESRAQVKGVSAGCCAGLLRRLFPRAPPGRALERYPPRIFLCAYMVLAHPDVVFNARGKREEALAAAGREMLVAFEALLCRLAEPPAAAGTAGTGSDGSVAEMLQRFDEAWVTYLEQFVAWKSADAAGLETELIRVAVELERSRLAKMAASATPRAHRLRSPEDLQAIAAGVEHDLQLIAERVRRLTGEQGAARLEAALTAARAAAAAEQREAMAASSSEGEASPPAPTGAVLARSPSQSPIKKAPRSSGRFHGNSSGSPPAEAEPRVEATSTPDVVAGCFSRSSSAMSVGSSCSGCQAASAALSAAVDMDAALAQQPNLPLMWALLYDPLRQLPTAELDAAWSDALGNTDPLADRPSSAEDLADPRCAVQAVQQRVKRIAERAFWDSVREGVAAAAHDAESTAEQVVGLLTELGGQLAGVLPDSAAHEVAARLDSAALTRELLPAGGGAGLDMPALFGLLEWCGGLLARYGAPARDEAAAAGQAALRQQVAAAAGEAGATGAAAVRALRLLSVQLKMLRVDAANAHLRALAAQLQLGGAAAWATAKLEAMLGSASSHGSWEQLGAWLPHSRAWLAGASGQLPQVEQLATLTAAAQSNASLVPERHQALPSLRAGLRASGAGPGGSSSTTQQLPLQAPVDHRSWQGLVRLGLVQLVSGEGTIGRLPLPELLRLDASRLHAAQGDFQRLLVLTTCLLLVRQGSATSGRSFGPADLASTKQRLAVLLADPAMRLPDLAAEVARLSGGELSAARERAVQDSIHRMLSRSSGAMKALSSGLSTALLALLLLDPDSSRAQEQAALALRRCGAADLAHEVAELAQQLAAVAAVSEAVCAQWYHALSSNLL